MKKVLLALILSASYIAGNGQAGELDSTFGINGLVRTDFGFNTPPSFGRDLMVQADGSFYFLIGVGDNALVAHFFANGNLDPSYGENGYSEVVPSLGGGRAIMQGDGKIVIGGSGYNNGGRDFLLARLTTDGILDYSFSEDGIQYTGFVPALDVITALAIQSDGKILAAGNAGGVVAFARYNPDGSLDNTFSDDGKLTGQPGTARSIAVQNDGKILLAGSFTLAFSFTGASVARYLQDGTLDSGFGIGGIRSFTFGPGAAFKSVAVQTDGKIVLGGTTSVIAGYEDFLVVRLKNDGTSDSSFSDDGIQTTNISGTPGDQGEALALSSDGKILLAGSTSFAPNTLDVALARYNSDGSLDNSFSGDGVLTTSIKDADFAFSIALLPDSRIMVAGTSIFLTGFRNYYFGLRYDTFGNLDNSFDGDGILVDSKPGGLTQFFTSAIQSDGRIIAGGHTWASVNNSEFAIARYNEDGTFDSSFSEDGRQTVGFGFGNDIIRSIKIQADGKIIAAGVGFNGNNSDFAIARFNPDGSLDNSFSDDGILLTDFNGEEDVINDIEIQPDGKIVVAGYSTAVGNRDFTIARYNADGTLDNSFSGDGKFVFDFAPRLNGATALIIQPDGKLVIVGNYNIQENSDVAIVRINPDGTPDPSFDGDGMLVTDIGAGNNDNATAAELQNDGKIITAGTITQPGGRFDFLLFRINGDGSSDTSFSSDGKSILDLGSNTESARSLAIQENGKILVGGSFFHDDGNGDFALVRLNSDGAADSSFAEDGIAIPEIKFGADDINSLSIFNNRVYAVGNTTYGHTLGSVGAFLLSVPVTEPLAVNIPDTFALPNGVEINTVYKGYEPASKLTLVAETSGGVAPYTYKWSTGATTASIRVGPSAPTTYSVTVTDANGTTAIASIMIKVVDVRCGYKLEKVLVCHKENTHHSATLCINAEAVASHLRHGDNLGNCRQSDESDFLTISAHPNPSRHSFDLSIKSNETVAAELIVWNILGKIMERRVVYTNSTVRIGAWYYPGIYLAEVKYKNKRARTKLIKLPH